MMSGSRICLLYSICASFHALFKWSINLISDPMVIFYDLDPIFRQYSCNSSEVIT